MDTIDDGSTALTELSSLLEYARDAFYEETGQERYKTCTRCAQQYDNHTVGGCNKHSSYYMGGSILEGRWVCCRQ